MASLNELQRYLGYTFSTGGITGEDYKIFQGEYINYLRSICKKENWRLTRSIKGHYCFSVFIKDGSDNYVYLSIPDVRYLRKNDWYNRILVRTAENDTDYTGGRNNYIDIEHLAEKMKSLFDIQNIRRIN